MSNAIAVRIPLENVNDESVMLIEWLVGEGEYVSEGQGLATVETSKANVEMPAPVSGYVRHNCEPGSEIEIGGILCHIVSSLNDEVPAAALPEPETRATPRPLRAVDPARDIPKFAGFKTSPVQTVGSSTTRFSRKAEELIKARGVPLEIFAGRGLVREIDVRQMTEPAVKEPSNSFTGAQAQAQLPATYAQAPTPGVVFNKEEPTRSKKLEIKMLAAGVANALPSSVTVSCRTRGLRALAQRNPKFKATVPAIIIYETAHLLRRFRELNGFFADGCANYYEEINIGYAVSAGDGLKVPVIRQADQKSLAVVSAEVDELLVAYVGGTLAPESLAGGTFTITDLSSEDVVTLAPLISRGQAAILAVGSEVIAGTGEGFFNLILSFDHQMTDGRKAAKFLNELRRRLAGYEDTLLAEVTPRHALEESVCAECLRPVKELKAANAHLLQSVRADGTTKTICTICLKGW
jgi:pyruvate/2-oxoglutarate dehydrogenase complex dihydrolipoamide acyltransferase (E2) component